MTSSSAEHFGHLFHKAGEEEGGQAENFIAFPFPFLRRKSLYVVVLWTKEPLEIGKRWPLSTLSQLALLLARTRSPQMARGVFARPHSISSLSLSASSDRRHQSAKIKDGKSRGKVHHMG